MDARPATRVTRATARLDSPPPMNEPEGFSPGLKGVVAGETSLALVDGANGRLLYRGYPIGELVARHLRPGRRAAVDG